MFNKFAIVCAVALLMTANVWAKDDPNLVKPPVIPAPMANGESIEPEVQIIHKKDRTIQEYRIHGQLYMIKVIPEHGYPYYLMDTNGDGTLDSRQDELNSGLLVPNWILLQW